ncbi:MAG: circadian clock KaiB family protein [Kovacikia sp.]
MINEVPQEETPAYQEDSADGTARFEQAIAQPEEQRYALRLYIAGTTPRSILALQNLKAVCETHLKGQYELEVIDVYQSPLTLQSDNVVAVPMLIKQLPLPLRRIIGDLSNVEKVLIGLDLIPK